jgi:hypothetical protein
VNLHNVVKWADFLMGLRNNLSEIKNLLSGHSKEIEVLRQQNILLLERIAHQNDTIGKLESRLGRLEDAAINRPSPRRAVGNTRADALRLPDTFEGSQS